MLKRRHRTSANEGEHPKSELELEIERRLESLRGTTAREVMTPRVDVVALEAPVSYEDVARAVRRSGHSHFPVYRGDLDEIVGVLYVKDVFHLGPLGSATVPSPAEVTRRLREPHVVPESRLVLELLAEMRKARRGFAVVVDEHGGVAGVLTINDLVSELVGDIQDEYDASQQAEIERVDQTRWLVDGSTSVDDVREEIGAPIPDGDYVTLGGYLFEAFGRIPTEGDSIEQDGWSYRVEEMERRRVDKVVVQSPGASGRRGWGRVHGPARTAEPVAGPAGPSGAGAPAATPTPVTPAPAPATTGAAPGLPGGSVGGSSAFELSPRGPRREGEGSESRAGAEVEQSKDGPGADAKRSQSGVSEPQRGGEGS